MRKHLKKQLKRHTHKRNTHTHVHAPTGTHTHTHTHTHKGSAPNPGERARVAATESHMERDMTSAQLEFVLREPLQALQSNRKKIINFFGTTNRVSKSNNIFAISSSTAYAISSSQGSFGLRCKAYRRCKINVLWIQTRTKDVVTYCPFSHR